MAAQRLLKVGRRVLRALAWIQILAHRPQDAPGSPCEAPPGPGLGLSKWCQEFLPGSGRRGGSTPPQHRVTRTLGHVLWSTRSPHAPHQIHGPQHRRWVFVFCCQR